MKKQFTLIVASLIFSVLFYDQNFGLNMLLFAITAITALALIKPKIYTRREMIISSILYLASAVFVFTVHSGFSIFFCFISFLVFAGTISGIQNAVYIQWLNGIYQSLLGGIHARFTKDPSVKKEVKTSKNYGFVILTIGIVATLLILFASLYGEANPIFKELLNKIDLDFININWFITALMGYLLLTNLISDAALDILTNLDREAKTSLKPLPISDAQKPLLEKERLLGTILLYALNGLILIFLITDIIYIFQHPESNATTLSETVHQGVNAIITSILIAVTLILIIFRGQINFIKNASHLRTLTFLWIGLNIAMVLFTAYKNYLYSSGFGLTYKRLGVFIYLILCIAGLITTYFKIERKQNFLFMVKANTRIAFITLLLICSIHWDRTITRYNLHNIAQPDMSYLKGLDNNQDLLYAFAKMSSPQKVDANIEKDYELWQARLNSQTWQSRTLLGLLNTKDTNYEVTTTQDQ